MSHRARATIFLLGACVLLVGCIGLRSEASRRGQKAWDEFFTKCGNSYYYAQGPHQILGAQTSPSILEEFRGVAIETESSPLTQADSLNGVEWKGSSRFTVKSSRMYMGGWQDWVSRAYVYSVDLEKRSGSWVVGKPVAMGFLAIPVSAKVNCSDIPR